MKRIIVFTVLLAAVLSFTAAHSADDGSKKEVSYKSCLACHKSKTPQIVNDWELSVHSEVGTTCIECHGSEHTSTKDVDEVKMATPETCNTCHPDRVSQFKQGKHALGWASAQAMPTTHWQPMELLEGQKGCTGCHKIGIADEETIKKLKETGNQYGMGSCDSCHTRHVFSRKEALQPQACRTCHMGMDHPQWEMYESSKHGVRYLLKQSGVLDESVAAPTCQTCHMNDGDHAVMTAWGFLAVRLPMPEDEQWAKDRTTVLKGLGVLSPSGEPTARLDVVKKAKVARLTEEAWQKERDEMLAICSDCHSENFARNELEKADGIIRETDKLLAHSIRTVAGLYEDGILEKPENYSYAYPDLLTFHDAPTTIETKLWLMFLKHRMRTFQGAFHANPDYTLWYGWSEMVRDKNEIDEIAERMRERASR